MTHRKKGFSLVELVIVLVIVALLSRVIVPIFLNAMWRSQLNACAEQLASHLRYARALAMARGGPDEQINFMTSTEHSYRICQYTGSDCFSSPLEKDPLDESKTLYVIAKPPAGGTGRPEWKDITFTNVHFPLPFGGPSFSFDKDGKPRHGFLFLPNETGIVTLYHGKSGQSLSVYILGDSGAVIVRTP